jgi:predicted site-specific integrase-resolvase
MSASASPPTASGVRQFSKARPLAARLGVCAKTLFRWADAGLIHRHKINARVVLFDEAEVIALVDQARVGGPITNLRASGHGPEAA